MAKYYNCPTSDVHNTTVESEEAKYALRAIDATPSCCYSPAVENAILPANFDPRPETLWVLSPDEFGDILTDNGPTEEELDNLRKTG